MSVDNYDRWVWESVTDDYNESTIKYSGLDMQDAYDAGRKYYQANHDKMIELEEANTKMMRLIILNDQKQALIEASPEFAEAIKNV